MLDKTAEAPLPLPLLQADKRFQLADWRVRPLTDEMLHYARSDTHFLLYAYDKLRVSHLLVISHPLVTHDMSPARHGMKLTPPLASCMYFTSCCQNQNCLAAVSGSSSSICGLPGSGSPGDAAAGPLHALYFLFLLRTVLSQCLAPAELRVVRPLQAELAARGADSVPEHLKVPLPEGVPEGALGTVLERSRR